MRLNKKYIQTEVAQRGTYNDKIFEKNQFFKTM